MKRSPRPEIRHREAVRLELHAAIERICEAWPVIESEEDAGKGRRTNLRPSGLPSSGVSRPTETAAMTQTHYGKWLKLLDDLRASIRYVDGYGQALKPRRIPMAIDDTTPLCAACNLPIPDKVRRIDGQPYHLNPCYNTERSRIRRAE